MTTIALVADDVRAAPCVPRASASSSVVRASESASPDAATVRSDSAANGARSIGPGMSTAAAIANAQNGTAFRASVHRVPPRAIETTRQRNASPSRPKRTMRDSTEKPSGFLIGCMRPHAAVAASVITMIVALRRSPPISRSSVTSKSETPNSISIVGSTGSGSRPAVNTLASDASAVNVTASTKQRDAMSSATAPLDRTLQLRLMQDAHDDAARREVREHLGARTRDRDREHAVVRASQREHGHREAAEDLRRHDDERRAP